MPPKKGEAKAGPAPAGAASPKPKATDSGSVWSKPGAPRSPTSAPGGSSAVKAKASGAVPSKTPVNIAAQAARNLGGFVPNKIFVGGVPITCTEEQFKSYFEPFGAIGKVELHALRGFGYITYESVESVDSCLEKYEDHYLCKKWVEVKRSIPRELIDAYEREQRRLHAEYLNSTGGGSSADAPSTKPDPPPAPSVSASPSPWGAAPSSSVARKSGGAGWGAPKAGPGDGNLSRIAQLEAMGFSGEVARKVLAECAWDVNAAIDRLLLSGVEMGADNGTPGDSAAEAPAPPEAAPPEPTIVLASAHAEPDKEERDQVEVHVDQPAPEEAKEEPEAAQQPQEPEPVVAAAAEKETPQEMTEVTEPEVPAADPPTAPAEAPPQPEPRKRFERIARGWHAEDPSQLGVNEGEFVRTWVDTSTDNGWIHAERADTTQAGWLPVVVLKEMEEGKKWMRVAQTWKGTTEENQCNVEAGSVVIVWANSRTPEGWTYVEVETDEGTRPGWLPAFCLEWNEI